MREKVPYSIKDYAAILEVRQQGIVPDTPSAMV